MVKIKDMPKYMLLVHVVRIAGIITTSMSLASISRHACTVLLYIVHFKTLFLSYLCLLHGRNVSEALRECAIEGVKNAASRSNGLMRPQ